ncbi:MAG: DUF1232 domain-containing protein [Treponema sp.]|nr:DUF1232 domain-containing protein [Treponema sp.]
MFNFKRSKSDPLSKEEEAKVNEEFESFKNKEYSEDDVNKVLDKEDEILKKLKNVNLKKFTEAVKLFFSMIKDFFTKKYTEVPVGTIMAIVGSLLYVFLPVDVIPDFIPVAGYLDDAAMLALCLKFVKSDLDKYKDFKDSQQ